MFLLRGGRSSARRCPIHRCRWPLCPSVSVSCIWSALIPFTIPISRTRAGLTLSRLHCDGSANTVLPRSSGCVWNTERKPSPRPFIPPARASQLSGRLAKPGVIQLQKPVSRVHDISSALRRQMPFISFTGSEFAAGYPLQQTGAAFRRFNSSRRPLAAPRTPAQIPLFSQSFSQNREDRFCDLCLVDAARIFRCHCPYRRLPMLYSYIR